MYYFGVNNFRLPAPSLPFKGKLAVKFVATLMLQAQQLWDGFLRKLWLSEWSFQKGVPGQQSAEMSVQSVCVLVRMFLTANNVYIGTHGDVGEVLA